MRKINSIWLFVTTVVLLPITVFGVVAWYENNYVQLPVFGEKDHKIDDFNMINQDGEKISVKNWENKIIVADFFFTHCASICPRMTINLKNVQQAFVNDQTVLINSFTVDPDRDSSSRLQTYATQFGINNVNWNLLTSDKKQIYRLARKSFLVVATDGDGGPNDFIHSEKLVLIDTEKKIRGFYNGTDASEVNQLIKDIGKLKKERRN
jgi:protein SCO1/2